MKYLHKKTEGALHSMDMYSTGNKVIYWGIFVILLMIALLCLLPPLWVLFSSLKTPTEIFKIPPTLLPESLNLGKYLDVWNLLKFVTYYKNTLILAAGSIFFSVIFNGITGYVLSCLKPRGTVLIMSLVTWTMLLPNTLSMVPLFKNMIDFPIFGFNLSNTFWPMWLVAGANAFNILLFINFFNEIPVSLIEAARLDGCGRVTVFRRIIMPLSKPIIAVVAIFTLNNTWSDFLLPYLVISNRSRYTVMIQIYSTRQTLPVDQQLISLVFTIIPPIIIFFFFQKYIMSGITIGGVKE